MTNELLEKTEKDGRLINDYRIVYKKHFRDENFLSEIFIQSSLNTAKRYATKHLPTELKNVNGATIQIYCYDFMGGEDFLCEKTGKSWHGHPWLKCMKFWDYTGSPD